YQAFPISPEETDTISVGACAQFCHNSYIDSGDFSVGFEIEVADDEPVSGKLCRCLVSAFTTSPSSMPSVNPSVDEHSRRLTESGDVPYTGFARELFHGPYDEADDPPISGDLPASFTTTISEDHEQIGWVQN
ncbi:hypothetical protein THAOC_27806, partial [Thalassiosira oceanica]